MKTLEYLMYMQEFLQTNLCRIYNRKSKGNICGITERISRLLVKNRRI